jgi:hypothetical protein
MEELIINLWAYYDSETRMVYGLAGRAYNFSGSDQEKLSLLKTLSRNDYLTAKKYEVPARFVISSPDGSQATKVTYLNTVNDPNAQLFEDIFKNLESELPPLTDLTTDACNQIKQRLPLDPLCVTTVLYEDEVGKIRPIISDEDREWIKEQEVQSLRF